MNARDYDTVLPARQPGGPWVVILKHRRTSVYTEGRATEYDEAKADALEALEREVAVHEAAAQLRAVGRGR